MTSRLSLSLSRPCAALAAAHPARRRSARAVRGRRRCPGPRERSSTPVTPGGRPADLRHGDRAAHQGHRDRHRPVASLQHGVHRRAHDARVGEARAPAAHARRRPAAEAGVGSSTSARWRPRPQQRARLAALHRAAPAVCDQPARLSSATSNTTPKRGNTVGRGPGQVRQRQSCRTSRSSSSPRAGAHPA